MDQDLKQPEIVGAAGVIAKAPTGRILMVKRTDTGESACPEAASKATRPSACHGVPARLSRFVPVVVYGEICRGRGALPRARTQERGGGDDREWMEKWAAFFGGADADNVVSIKREVA